MQYALALEMTWHTLAWSFLMGALCWLFVRMWSEVPYNPHRPQQRRTLVDRIRGLWR